MVRLGLTSQLYKNIDDFSISFDAEGLEKLTH